MFENNNKAVIKRIAKRSLTSNAARNTIAIIAIAVTAMLFTTLFTISLNLVKSFERSTMRQVGTSNHGGFKNLTTEQYETLRTHPHIKAYGSRLMLAFAENKKLAKRQVELSWMDDHYMESTFVKLMKGGTPQKQDEVVVDTITLDLLGLPYELGQKVTLEYRVMGQKYRDVFTIRGISEGDPVRGASDVLLSKAFVEKRSEGVQEQYMSGSYTGESGLYVLSVMLDSKYNIEEKLTKILQDKGYNVKQSGSYGYAENGIAIAINWAYLNDSSLSADIVVPIIGFILIIIISGYLIIYNIFYISVVKDIRFFGLLKTIGTTPKQLKAIIYKQVLKLCTVAIPIGLAAGYMMSMIITPYIVTAGGTMTSKDDVIFTANPLTFVLAALFAFVTVVISCRKSAKTAAGISPVEAVRYTGTVSKGRKKTKNSEQGAKLYRMAWSNLMRNKIKVIFVILSLSLSLMITTGVYTLIGGFDIEQYLANVIATDFTVGSTDFYRYRFRVCGDNKSDKNPLTPQMLDMLQGMDGVKQIDKIYFLNARVPTSPKVKSAVEAYKKDNPESQNVLMPTVEDQQINGIDKGLYDKLMRHIVEGEFDRQRFETGDYLLMQPRGWSKVYQPGDKIDITYPNGNTKTYTIMCMLGGDIPFYARSGYFSIDGYAVYIPADEFVDKADNPQIMTAMFDVRDGYAEKMEDYLVRLTTKNPSLDYRSRQFYVNEHKSLIGMIAMIGYTLSFILGLIGIINFVNVTVTAIYSRRLEFSIMQSIGMTSKQLKTMLKFEGLYYTALAVLTSVVVGLPLIYAMFRPLVRASSFFTYRFTMLPITLCLPVLAVLSIAVPVLSFKSVEKLSIIERLRDTE